VVDFDIARKYLLLSNLLVVDERAPPRDNYRARINQHADTAFNLNS